MRRHVLATAALVLLVFSSGCLGFIRGPQPIEEKTLDSEPPVPYEWNTTRDVHIQITGDQFTAVYDVSNPNFSAPLAVYRNDPTSNRYPLSVQAVRYRYPNGTVVTGSAFEAAGGQIRRTDSAVEIVPPGDDGKLAFTAEATPKRFTLPVYVEGSYAVVLPPDRETSLPILGKVIPRPTRTETVGDQVHLYWDVVRTDTLVVQYYLARDVTIFGTLAAVILGVGLGGFLYYRRQIQRLREKREEMGLDVDMSDDDLDDGPPPGMR